MANMRYGFVDDGQLPLDPSCCNSVGKCCDTGGGDEALIKVNEILKDASTDLNTFKEVLDRFESIEEQISELKKSEEEEDKPCNRPHKPHKDKCDGEYVTKREFYKEIHSVKQGIPIYLHELEDSEVVLNDLYDKIRAEFEEKINALTERVLELENKLGETKE